MAKNILITASELRELMTYDPETGNFIRVVTTSPRAMAGMAAGCLSKTGYIYIHINHKKYRAHRLAWLFMTGAWPEHDIDHKNLNKSDNSWQNLRPCTMSQNIANTENFTHNTSGRKGVYWYKPYQKWKAQIQVNMKAVFLGYFDKKEDAIEARRIAEIKYFGEFARAT